VSFVVVNAFFSRRYRFWHPVSVEPAFTELLDIINELFFAGYFVADTVHPDLFGYDYRHAFIIPLPDFQITHLPGKNPSPPMQ